LNGERREKKKTILRTIRIDKDLDDALDKDANEHSVSENALISSILAKYVEWDRSAEKFGRVSLPHEALKAIIEATEPDKLRTAAEEFATSVPKDYIMFAYKKLDLEACLLHLSFLSRYAGMFKYELRIERERNYIITIHHKFGEKWSYWLKESISYGLFKNILGITPKINLSKSSVVFTFLIP
jgi:predicted transcriptional regulator